MAVPIAALAGKAASSINRLSKGAAAKAKASEQGLQEAQKSGGPDKHLKKLEEATTWIKKQADRLKNLEVVTRFMAEMAFILRGVKQVLKGMFDAIVKSSPLLLQQMIIFRKSIELLLRPIGDILAVFLRPLVIKFFEFAMRMYNFFGIGGKNKDTVAEIDDEKARLTEIYDRQVAEGDTKGAENTLRAIAAVEARRENLTADDRSPTGGISDALWDGVRDSLEWISAFAADVWSVIGEDVSNTWELLKGAFSELIGVFKSLWNLLGPTIIALGAVLAILGGAALLGALQVIKVVLSLVHFALLGLKTVIDFVIVGAILLEHWFQKLRDWIADKLVQGLSWLIEKIQAAWEKVKEFGNSIKTFFTETLPKIFSDLVKKLKDMLKPSNIISGIGGGIASAAKGLISGEGSTGISSVPTTGLYKLHAGEEVIRASDVQAGKTGSISQVFHNNFVFPNANFTDEQNVKRTMEQMAKFLETELRRRTSL